MFQHNSPCQGKTIGNKVLKTLIDKTVIDQVYLSIDLLRNKKQLNDSNEK